MSRKKEALILKNLEGLASNEARLLLDAVGKKAQTIYWAQDASEVHLLMDKGLLESVSDESTVLHKPFRIPRFVWDHMQQEEVFQSLKGRLEAESD